VLAECGGAPAPEAGEPAFDATVAGATHAEPDALLGGDPRDGAARSSPVEPFAAGVVQLIRDDDDGEDRGDDGGSLLASGAGA
jgi:hypothetical protein